MQRTMQNLSFLVIIAVLLGCGFLFSQQSNPEPPDSTKDDPSSDHEETIADIPDCSGINSGDDLEACSEEGVGISKRLLNAAVDEILSLESDAEERLTFVNVQTAWEESRDADCSFVFDRTDDPQQARIEEAICLREHNLARSAQLKNNLCDWYAADGCPGDGLADE